MRKAVFYLQDDEIVAGLVEEENLITFDGRIGKLDLSGEVRAMVEAANLVRRVPPQYLRRAQ